MTIPAGTRTHALHISGSNGPEFVYIVSGIADYGDPDAHLFGSNLFFTLLFWWLLVQISRIRDGKKSGCRTKI